MDKSRVISSFLSENLSHADIITQWRGGLGKEFDNINQSIDLYNTWPAGWHPNAQLDALQELATNFLKQYHPTIPQKQVQIQTEANEYSAPPPILKQDSYKSALLQKKTPEDAKKPPVDPWTQ